MKGSIKKSEVEISTLFDEEFIKKLEYWSLVFKRVYGGQLSATRRSKEVGSGIEFADRREYTPGDDLRYFDWKALGRMDRSLVRLFLEEKDLKVNIIIDSSGSMKIGSPSKLHCALRIGAILSYIVIDNLDRVSIAVFSEGISNYLPPARGKARISKILAMFEEITAGGQTDFGRLAREIAAREKKRGVCVIISDLLTRKGLKSCIDMLTYQGGELNIIQILATEDENPSNMGEYELHDVETGESLKITITPSVMAEYKRVLKEEVKEVESYALKKGATIIKFNNQMTIDEQIATILRNVGKRKK